MKMHVRDLARAVLDLAEKASPAEKEALLEAALRYLVAHGLAAEINIFPRILEDEWHRRENSVSALLATPSGHAGAHAETLSATLSKLLNKRVGLTEEKDPDLLGGARLSYGDERFDRSIRSALDRFEEHVRSLSPA
ncbi:F0F1 ATP synthase subunit delta [Candidatus Peregrinibacteria bacterium]|nr:F0F1 ATP synthase subunit delta [Candidatus Peregrinibacteria bacterium]